jgi:GGDEF domain-containing protein
MDASIISALVVACGLSAAALVLVTRSRAHAEPQRANPFTALPDRAAVLAAATSWLALPGPLRAVALVDVDGEQGVDAAVLAHVAQRLTGALRAEDVVGRYGDERFVIMLRGDSAAGLQGAVERALAATRSAQLAASAGLALVDPRDRDLHNALRAADAALGRAKQQGRDRVVVASMADQPLSAALAV